MATPLQLSVAVKTSAAGTESHSTVISPGVESNTGAVVSTIVKVAVVVTVFKSSSVAVNITVALPVAPHSSLKPVKSLLQVTSLQLLNIVAPPLSFNQSIKSSIFPRPSHSTVKSCASTSITGARNNSTYVQSEPAHNGCGVGSSEISTNSSSEGVYPYAVAVLKIPQLSKSA